MATQINSHLSLYITLEFFKSLAPAGSRSARRRGVHSMPELLRPPSRRAASRPRGSSRGSCYLGFKRVQALAHGGGEVRQGSAQGAL